MRLIFFPLLPVASLDVPYSEGCFDTSFGQTHCLLVGDPEKPRICTIHGGNGITTLNADVKGSFKIVKAYIEAGKVDAARMIYKKPGKYLAKLYISVDNVQLNASDYTYKYYEGEVIDVTAPGVRELTSRDKLTIQKTNLL